MASYLIEKDKLKGEYNKAFDQVECYTVIRSMNEDTREEMLMNLVDMLYSAQLDGKPVEKIVGKDMDQFCREYFSEYNNWQQWIKSLPSWLYSVMLLVTVFSILELISPEEEWGSIWNAQTEVSSYLLGIMAGVVSSLVFMIIGNIIWTRYKKIHSTWFYVGIIIAFVLTVSVSVYFSWNIQWKIPLIPVLFIAGGYVIVYKCLRLYDRYKKYGNFKKPPKDGSLKEIFQESIKETTHKELPLELKKVYDKKNKKLAKRGKPVMTAKDFMEYLYKQERQMKIGNWIIIAVYIGLYLHVTISMIFDSETTSDETILFSTIFAVILGIIYYGVYKLLNVGISTRRTLLRECEEKGITVLDLAQQIEEEDKEE